MNSGVLQFSLGLATGGFLSPLNSTMSRLTGFIGGMVSLGAITEGVMSAIERGAALEHLSKRTNTSVADLFKLQRGFKAVGMDADAVGGILFKMQKSLGGVNEYGVDTKSIFHRMGLEIDTLKKMNAPQQLAAIAGGLGKLNTTSAASAAGSIFGREGAQQMVQLSRSTGEFAEAMRKAARDAENAARTSASFARLERGLVEIKGHVQTLFAGLAEGLAPSILSIEAMINKMDFTRFGENIGQQVGGIMTAFTQAFKEGKLSELIGDALQLGFDSLLIFAPGMFEKIGYFLLRALESPLAQIQAGMEYALEAGAHAFATSKTFQTIIRAIAPGAGLILGAIGDTGKVDYQQILKDRKEEGVKFNLFGAETGIGDANKDSDKRLAEAGKKFKEKWAGFSSKLGDFQSRAPNAFKLSDIFGTPAKNFKEFQKTGGTKSGVWGPIVDAMSRAPKPKGVDKIGDSLQPTVNHYKPEFTSLEKMGFVMGGGSNPILDLNRRTATAAEKTVALLGKISGQLDGNNGGSVTNQI